MLPGHIALLTLVGLTPLLAFFDGRLVDGLVELYAAAALAVVAFSIRPGEGRHWFNSIRWAVALAALPALWLIIQSLPLPIGALSGSIWQSAASTLGMSMWPSITIDPGLTVLALCRYASLAGIGAVAAAASIDRQHAERVLFALGGAAVAFSLISVVLHLGDWSVSKNVRAAATAGSVYGVVLTAAIIILVVERHLTRRTLRDFRWQFLVPLAATVACFAICVLATIVAGSEQAIFAAACGFAVVAIIQFVRRIGLDWRAAATMAGAAVVAAAVIVSTKAHPTLANFSMRYAARAPADDISVADRVVGEVGLGGSGAGTFSAIYRLYASGDTASTNISAPTSAAQIAIELGRPMLWVIVASMAALILLCARGGFNRGRDFFYSIAGAGVGVATLIFMFCDIGLNNMAISILLATMLGLALAQSASRTV